MGSLEIYDSFQPYSDRDDTPPSTFADVKPDSVAAARAAIDRFRDRHGRKQPRATQPSDSNRR
ncbi:MAG: hypothetical protein AB7I52_00785 [Rhizobiaceae bacterium]